MKRVGMMQPSDGQHENIVQRDVRRWTHQPSIQPGYLPLREAARWAGVSPRTLKRWIRRGLPTYQAGPREKVLVRPKDIDNFLVRREKPQISLDAIVEETISSLVTGA